MERNKEFNLWMASGIFAVVIIFSSVAGCIGNQASEPANLELQNTTRLPATVNPDQTQPSSQSQDFTFQNVNDSPDTGPIRMTIHSAQKTTDIKNLQPKPGKILVVINATIVNLDEMATFVINEKSININDGGLAPQVFQLSNPFPWGAIPPKNSMNGEILFAVTEDVNRFTITLLDVQGNVVLIKEIGTIPAGPYIPSKIPPPLSITIHSAIKNTKIKTMNALPGNILLVVNTTIENHSENESFNADENTVDITGGGPAGDPVYRDLTNPFYWGPIPPNSSRTGEIVFGMKRTMEEVSMLLRDDEGNVILAKTVGNVPLGIYGEIQVPDSIGQDTILTQNTQPINVTIHSAFKTMEIKDTHPMPGNVFIIINMTIQNLASTESFTVNESTIDITGGGPITQKLYNRLSNPFYWGPVPPKSSRTGEIVFGVKASTDQFTLTLLDEQGNVLLTKPIGTIPSAPYLPALENSDLLNDTNFTSVVESLDTPEKAAQYSDAKFTFVYHDGCISYPPEEFFRRGEGDCKDYATFLSYVLAYHRYDARIVAFKYFKNGERNGHVVTLFTDKDGQMYYMTTPSVSNLRSVSSVEDLLQKECARLGVPTIANHKVLPAGSLDTCVP